MFTKTTYVEFANKLWKDKGCPVTHKACAEDCPHIDNCMKIASMTALKALADSFSSNLGKQIAKATNAIAEKAAVQ